MIFDRAKGMESKPGENFLSVQCKDGGGLKIFTHKDKRVDDIK